MCEKTIEIHLNHFIRHKKWRPCVIFRRGWNPPPQCQPQQNLVQLAPTDNARHVFLRTLGFSHRFGKKWKP